MRDNVRVVNAAVIQRKRRVYEVDGRIATSNGKAHIHVIFTFYTSTISDFVHHQTCFFWSVNRHRITSVNTLYRDSEF